MDVYSFGEWVSRRRKMLDLTQRDLAERAHCALATIKKIETDERRPSRELAEGLAAALRVPPELRPLFADCARGLRAVDALASLLDEESLSAQASSSRLPRSAAPFLGREADLAQMTVLLTASDCRLLTLVGPGGIGKTRLALEAARHVESAFPQGAFFVPLAAISDAALIPVAIAQQLQISLNGPADSQVEAFLRGRALLLVLDNCEQLGDGVVWLSELLSEAPGIRLLVTSRERLALADEWVFDVPTLDEPDAQALFTEAAQRAQVGAPSLDLAAVARICDFVGRLPLAIELAASWTPYLGLDDIADQIKHDVDFLAAQRRDVPARHRSMRAVFDTSWSLLSPAEQRAFARLSVFRGGWTADESGPVAGANLFLLRGLADKSLVRQAGAGRWDMHELARQYAADQLAAAGLEAETRQRHCAKYVALGKELFSEIQGPNGIAAFERFDREQDNLRAAFHYALDSSDRTSVERLLAHLALYWLRRGLWREGEDWSRRALALAGETEDRLLLRALHSMAMFLGLQARYRESGPYLARGMVLARHLEETDLLVAMLMLWAQATPHIEESATAIDEILRITKDDPEYFGLVANADSIYGDRLRDSGPRVEAEERFRRSLAMYRQIGNVDMVAYPLGNLGRAALESGHLSEARALITESVAISRAIRNRVGIADWLQQLGYVALSEGNLVEAEIYLQEALTLYEETNNLNGSADVEAALGQCALVAGDLPKAKQRFALALQHWQARFSFGGWPSERWSRFQEFRNLLWAVGILFTLRGEGEVGERVLASAQALSKGQAVEMGLWLRAPVANALSDIVPSPAEVLSPEAVIEFALELLEKREQGQ